MDYENVVMVRGLDLFFEDVSEKTLQDICKDLGGKASYNFEEKKATYMLRKSLFFETEKIEECHDVANFVGQCFAKKYGCTFLFSELYLRTTEKQWRTWDTPNVAIKSATQIKS